MDPVQSSLMVLSLACGALLIPRHYRAWKIRRELRRQLEATLPAGALYVGPLGSQSWRISTNPWPFDTEYQVSRESHLGDLRAEVLALAFAERGAVLRLGASSEAELLPNLCRVSNSSQKDDGIRRVDQNTIAVRLECCSREVLLKIGSLL